MKKKFKLKYIITRDIKHDINFNMVHTHVKYNLRIYSNNKIYRCKYKMSDCDGLNKIKNMLFLSGIDIRSFKNLHLIEMKSKEQVKRLYVIIKCIFTKDNVTIRKM